MSTFYLEIVVPDRAFYADEVQELVVKTPGGEIGILRGHLPMVVAVAAGPVKMKKNDEWVCAFVSEGFMEITGDKVIVLVDSAEWPEEIDIERAKAAEAKARERLGARQSYGTEDMKSKAALQRALWRQKVSGKRNQ